MLRVPGEFARPVAMNAYDKKPVGKNGSIRLVRIVTSDGSFGLGVEGYVPIDEHSFRFLKDMIGVDPEEVFLWENDRIVGHTAKFANQMKDERNCWFEMALLDLVGKRRNCPVYRLFGDAIRDRIDVYDGSLYFVDVESGKGAEAVAQIAREIREDGYRGLKIKVGRPWKWMPGEAGVVRDIDAVIAAREAVGANMNLMADANNGYQGHFNWAVRFLRETSLYKLGWIEEIFPETVEDYTELHRVLQKVNADLPVADALIEDDRYHDYALDTSAYVFREGCWLVPEEPGWGVELSPEYKYFTKASEETVIS